MFHLVMRTPTKDVLLLVCKRLKVDESRQSAWMERGQRPFRAATSRHASVLGSRADEVSYPSQDHTPEVLRRAAYQVEARRSLLSAVDEVVLRLLTAAAFASAVVAAFGGAAWGAGGAAAAVVLVALLRQFTAAQAAEVVPFRQSAEPLAWALYYPGQMAMEAIAAREQMKALGQRTPQGELESYESHIRRGPDGRASAGQEAAVADATYHRIIVLPGLFAETDSGRLLAKGTAMRATTAAELIRAESRRALGASTWALFVGPAVADAAERLAEHAYACLMSQVTAFLTPPRRALSERDLDASFVDLAAAPAVEKLVSEAKALLALAEDAASGYWPPEESSWSLPSLKRWSIASAVIGLAAVLVGLRLGSAPDFSVVGDALVGVGSVLLPGTLGQVVKEALAVRSSPASA